MKRSLWIYVLLFPGCAHRLAPWPHDFLLTTMAGVETRLSDYRASVVVVNFWSSWCKSCVAELRSFDNLGRNFTPRQLTVVGVMVDDSLENLIRAKHTVSSRLALLRDGSGTMKEFFQIRGLPTTILIDCRGEILSFHDPLHGDLVSRVTNSREWDSPRAVDELRRLLAEANGC